MNTSLFQSNPCKPLFGYFFAVILSASVFSVNAALISPTGISSSTLSGTNDTTDPFTDDIMLDSLTFGTTTLNATSGQIAAVQSTFVVSGRTNTNAEWGDNDDDSDGNPDPFTRVGLNPANQESTVPAVQDLALASAFSSLSLSEITDGEGGGSVTNFIFANGVIDNDSSLDDSPEIVLFERGNNDTTTIRAITGGTFDNPVLTGSVTITPDDMWNTGISIDTVEISNVQELAAIGIDLNDFGITDSNTIVYGLQIETEGGDFGGFFQAAEDPDSQFSEVTNELLNPSATIPEPSSLLLTGVFVGLAASRRRRHRMNPR